MVQMEDKLTLVEFRMLSNITFRRCSFHNNRDYGIIISPAALCGQEGYRLQRDSAVWATVAFARVLPSS